ncbi:MAG: hypothetical protein U0790_16745 [Isosphaeraceae bacterium]
MADGLIAPLEHPEVGFFAQLLYPLRSAESMAVVGFMACVLWGFTILVPEYCLGVWGDANTLGTPSMGMLVILISVIPPSLLFPLFLAYLLQYLGRVLVSSAQGDPVPPRTPDRNFDGLTAGLSPWLVWLVLGLSISVVPAACTLTRSDLTPAEWLLWGLVSIGLGIPYAAIALMLSFLHDHPLAATPWGVVGAAVRLGVSFLPTLFRVAVPLALAGGFAALVFALREPAFWGYILAALLLWVVLLWAAMVIVRILGLHYFRHHESLRWHPRQSRWGVAWRL